MAINNESALEKTLPKMAKDIGVMKMGIMKLVAVQAGTPRAKAEQFFANQANKESAYEAKYAKSPTPTRTTSTGGSRSSGKGLGLGPSTSVIDFIKNIANMLIKGALLSLGTMGLAKLLESESTRESIKSFIKNLFMSILNVIKTGATMFNEVMKENWPQVKEAIIATLVAIKNLLVTSIQNIGDLLSDKRIWEGLWEIIKTIFDAIKKVLSTEIEIGNAKVSLAAVLGTVVVAFIALKGATWLLKQAAESAAKSLFGIGAAGAAGGMPDVPGKGGKGEPKAKGKYGRMQVFGATAGSLVGGMILNNMLTAGSDTLVDLTGADTEITDELKKLDDLNWEKASMWERVQSGLARGLENVASFLGAEKTANAAKVERIKGETKYLDEKHPLRYQDEVEKQKQIMQAAGLTYGTLYGNKNASPEAKEQARLNYESEKSKYEKMASTGSNRPSPNSPTQETAKDGAVTFNSLTREQQDALLAAQRKQEGFYPGSLSYDLNNPGNLLYSQAAAKFGAVPDNTGRGVGNVKGKFAKFPTLEQGIEAQRDLWTRKYGNMPLDDAIKMWTGEKDLTKISAYRNAIHAAAGSTGAPIQVATATPSQAALPSVQVGASGAAQEETNPLLKMLADFDKMSGGKLGLSSSDLAAAWKMVEKEIMSGPTFVDNSTNVSKAGGDVVSAQGSPAVRDENILNKIMAMRVA